jgi:hypothetical protein|tara:strand:+ start:1540 stop:1782 length:243 start_codon:yes stop_codon:yes gene_type:complete
MSIDEKPKYKTFRVVEEYDVQVTYEVEVPVVYDEDEPLVFLEKENCYVEPEDAVENYKHEKVDEDWEFRGTLETKEIPND